MSDVLKDAEGRVPGSVAARQAEEELAVAMARQEIGQANYEAAKQQLPIIEKAAREELLPWCARTVAIAQETGDYPEPIRQAVENIGKSCESYPRQLREGIARYEQLRFADIVWKDGRQVDVNRRVVYIGKTRDLLRSYDGALSYMRGQKGQAETYIKAAEWPRRAGESPPRAVGVIVPERPAGIQVEMGGGPVPPRL